MVAFRRSHSLVVGQSSLPGKALHPGTPSLGWLRFPNAIAVKFPMSAVAELGLLEGKVDGRNSPSEEGE